MENLATLGRQKSGELMFQNPTWTPIDTINVQVWIEGEWHDYHCTDYDEVPHGVELWKQLTTTYREAVAPCSEEAKYEWAEANVLADRHNALKATDWMACADVKLRNQSEWLTYRQAWRDITQAEGYPFTMAIPEKPSLTKNAYYLE